MSNESLQMAHGDDSLTAKIASLTSIQQVVTRMASNSQMMKTWAMTVVTGFVTIQAKLNGLGCLSYLVPLLICISFAYLDAYYLSQERIFRDVYNTLASVAVGSGINYLDFNGEIKSSSCIPNNSVVECYKSPSVFYFYAPLTIISTMILMAG